MKASVTWHFGSRAVGAAALATLVMFGVAGCLPTEDDVVDPGQGTVSDVETDAGRGATGGDAGSGGSSA